jgi:uncharacterized protein (DUF2164 family)
MSEEKKIEISFKEKLIADIIPRIEKMMQKEKEHMIWLIDNSAPIEFIQLSQTYYDHFVERVQQYKKYAGCI